jgi:molybdopterin-dependent oxidoreductase alpha subunit
MSLPADSGQPRDARSLLGPEAPEAAIQIGRPAESAGGPQAVQVALTTSMSQMGAVRAVSTLLNLNQQDGFDCPGCAWPDPAGHRSTFEFCENGAKAVAEEATLARADRDFFAARSVHELAALDDHRLGKCGRIVEPMHHAPGDSHYRPISWDEAFALVGRHLRALPSPNEAVFYTSGRTSNEAAFLYQLFVRMYGTNNLPDCSNLCHESSGVAMTRSIGAGKGTVSLQDFEHADCIVVIGQNPGSNHPRMLSTLQAAARRGCRIVSINPLAEAGLKRFRHPQELSGMLGTGTRLASLHVPVRVNGDVALLKGVQKAMLERGIGVDHAFIADFTEGFEAHRADLERESWPAIERGSGISERLIREVAEMIGASRALICCWAMGLTQHENAVANIQQIVNLLLLGGHLGRPGAGACPVRGHSNVQGDRTMGIWERPTDAFLDRIGCEFGFDPPRAHGYSTVEAIDAMHRGDAKVFVALGGNFLSATPDTAHVAEALQRCRLTVQISTKLNRSHLITGQEALILPCLGRTERDLQRSGEQFVSVEDSMGVVHASRGRLAPASPMLRSEPAIVAGLAKATLGTDWSAFVDDYDRIRDRIARSIPGFEDMNTRIRHPDGFTLPHAVRDRRAFHTPSGKAVFFVHPIPQDRLGAGELMLTTIRSHDQFNTSIHGLDDRYRGVRHGRRVVFMHPADIAAQGLADGGLVDLVNRHDGRERRARNFRIVSYDIPQGCAATYFPEANVLVPIGSIAEGSLTPASKSVIVRVETASQDAGVAS